MRKLAVLACAAALVAASCTSGGPGKPGKSPTPAASQHYAVSVDASPQTVTYNGSSVTVPLVADLFFPSALSVHPGDSVTFNASSNGNVHTVTLGTLIDQAASAPNPLPSPSRGVQSPTGAAAAAAEVPGFFQSGYPGIHSDAVASAAQPCFLSTGVPPQSAACPQVAQPDFNGAQAFYNSGWLAPGSSFTLTVSASTPPGTYQFRDLAHPEMTGALTVVPTAEPIPPPSQVASTGTSQLQAAALAQAPAATEAATVTTTLVAGISEVGVTNTFVAAFGPPTLTVTAGATVAWNVFGEQAIAIDPPPGATGLLTRSSSGAVHVNSAVITHSGGFSGPPGPAPRPETVNGESYATTGFHNSGLMVSGPPNLLTYILRFVDPGTFTVQSLTYPSMTETINVVSSHS
ncbi:MAG: cupredoxin domain-containing protein [Actinomycetota bacterium]